MFALACEHGTRLSIASPRRRPVPARRRHLLFPLVSARVVSLCRCGSFFSSWFPLRPEIRPTRGRQRKKPGALFWGRPGLLVEIERELGVPTGLFGGRA